MDNGSDLPGAVVWARQVVGQTLSLLMTRKTHRIPLIFIGVAIFTSFCWGRGLQIWFLDTALPEEGPWRADRRRAVYHWFAFPLLLLLLAAVVFFCQLLRLIWLFPERPEAATSLRADLERARSALVARGFRFDKFGSLSTDQAVEPPFGDVADLKHAVPYDS